MQCYLEVKISDLDGCVPKSIHEFPKGLIVCLSNTSQGGRGNVVRPAGGVLRTKSFDDGIKAVYGLRWESTILGQCCPLEGRWKDTT